MMLNSSDAELGTDMECDVYIVRAFCPDHLGGNLAGVVFEPGPSDEKDLTA